MPMRVNQWLGLIRNSVLVKCVFCKNHPFATPVFYLFIRSFLLVLLFNCAVKN